MFLPGKTGHVCLHCDSRDRQVESLGAGVLVQRKLHDRRQDLHLAVCVFEIPGGEVW
jgi:hypothetical protein